MEEKTQKIKEIKEELNTLEYLIERTHDFLGYHDQELTARLDELQLELKMLKEQP